LRVVGSNPLEFHSKETGAIPVARSISLNHVMMALDNKNSN